MPKLSEKQSFKLYGGEVLVDFQPNPYHMYWVTDPIKNGGKKTRTKGVTTPIGIMDKSRGLVIWATRLAGMELLDMIEAGKEIKEEDVIRAINLHAERKQQAADLGTEIHAWCEYFIRHKLKEEGFEKKPELPDKEKNNAVYLGAQSFIDWVVANKVEFLHSEKIVYNRDHGYVGNVDIVARVNDQLALCDLKSSNDLYNSVRMQTAAYAKAYELEHGVVFDTRIAIRLSKECESDYYARKERECYIAGKSVNYVQDYKPLDVMEFKGRDSLEFDFNAFLAARTLYQWNDETDFFKARQQEKLL
jgi:hypothetical protein